MSLFSVDWKCGSYPCNPPANSVEDRRVEISVDNCTSTFLHCRRREGQTEALQDALSLILH